MKKKFLFFKKYLFLTALLCLGIIRSAAQDAAPTVKSEWRAELGLFYAGVSYEQRVASRFSLVGHFDLLPEWGRMVYGNPNMKFGGLVPTFQVEGRWYYSGYVPEIPVDTWHCVQTLPGTMLVCSVQRNMTTTMWFPAV
jgi:hypothetical protein